MNLWIPILVGLALCGYTGSLSHSPTHPLDFVDACFANALAKPTSTFGWIVQERLAPLGILSWKGCRVVGSWAS